MIFVYWIEDLMANLQKLDAPIFQTKSESFIPPEGIGEEVLERKVRSNLYRKRIPEDVSSTTLLLIDWIESTCGGQTKQYEIELKVASSQMYSYVSGSGNSIEKYPKRRGWCRRKESKKKTITLPPWCVAKMVEIVSKTKQLNKLT